MSKLLEAKNQIKGLYLDNKQVKGLLLATKDIKQAQLPKKKRLSPYISVELPSTHGTGLRNLQSILVTGNGFDPRYPMELTLDGIQLKTNEKPIFDKEGKFQFVIPPTMDVGGHTLRIEQKTDKGVIRDAYTFNLTVQDFPNSEEGHESEAKNKSQNKIQNKYE